MDEAGNASNQMVFAPKKLQRNPKIRTKLTREQSYLEKLNNQLSFDPMSSPIDTM